MDSAIQLQSTRRALLVCPLLFLVFGPLIAFVTIWLPRLATFELTERAGGRATLAADEAALSLLGDLLMATYAYGAPAALAIGVLYAACSLWMPPLTSSIYRRVLLSAGLGVTATSVLTFFFFVKVGLLLEAACAGVGCALLIGFSNSTRSVAAK